MDENIVAVDIGATKIHIGLVNGAEVIKEQIFPTAANAAEEVIIMELIQAIEEVAGSEFLGIGIGVPGLVDEETGIIYDLNNIPSWKEVPLKEILEAHFHKPVKLTNDANMFALGVSSFGKGASFKNILGITLGSGLGSGIIINKKLYSGTLSSAGELGSIPYLEGTLEDYCSGKFFRNEYGADGKSLCKLAEKGDEQALQIFHEFGQHLGNALRLVCNVLSPEAIFFGGSVSKSFKFFEVSLREKLSAYPFKRVSDHLIIEPSSLPKSSLMGAAALFALDQTEKQEYIS